MTPAAPATVWRNAHNLLRQRCLNLGLPTWGCDEAGQLVDSPTGPTGLAAWLGTSLWRDRIQNAILSHKPVEDEKKPNEPIQVTDCCWILVLDHRQGQRIVGRTVVLVIEDGVNSENTCAEIARDCKVDTAEAMPLVAPMVRSKHQLQQLNEMLTWTCRDLTAGERHQSTLNQFGEKLVQAYEETNMLFRFARSLNCINDPEQLMTLICQQLQQTLPLRWVAVRFCENNAKSKAVPALAGKLICAGEVPCAEQDLDHHVRELLEDWSVQDWTRILTPTESELARRVGAEVIAEQITHDGIVIGFLLAGNRLGEEGDLSSAEIQFIDASADFLGVFHENLARFVEQRSLFTGTLQALTASIDAKDRYTCGHSERVALLGAMIARGMGMNTQTVEQYHIAGMVHDVGKIGVPEAVLCKPGRLTPEEFDAIKRHPQIGYDILKDIPQLAPMLPGVLYHHERWDGKGYPAGLGGTDIPLMGRVLAMADAFDAMSSNRSYRPAMLRSTVFEEVRKCSGVQFDPEIASMFLALDFTEFDAALARHQSQSRMAA